jgi:CS domain
MSKLPESSKFDNLDKGSIETADGKQSNKKYSSQPPAEIRLSHETQLFATNNQCNIQRDDKHPGRYYFQYNGENVYQFQQDLDQMTIYVTPPPHVQKGSQIQCEITACHVKLGLKENQEWYLNESTYGKVDVDESTWSLEEDEDSPRQKVICIYLTKANRGVLWDAALKGDTKSAIISSNSVPSLANVTLSAFDKEQVKKELMLQRFQEENPGFDFRGAEFNGSIPDARDFMGGVKYD